MSTCPRPNSCRPCARAVPHLPCLTRAEVSVSSAARLPLLLVTTYTQAATHMHTCTHVRMNTNIRSVHPSIHEYMHTYIHTHSPMHACHPANTHIHTYSVLQSISQTAFRRMPRPLKHPVVRRLCQLRSYSGAERASEPAYFAIREWHAHQRSTQRECGAREF